MDTLLVVEDEPSLRDLLADCLGEAGFAVVVAAGGAEAVELARRHAPDLLVLDVMLPDLDGFDVLRRLRGGGSRTPVLFLTARDSTADKVRGLSGGGDDYVTKPFSLDELVARIHALLRRGRAAAATPVRLAVADLELDQDAHAVWRAGREVRLSATEFQLLRYFMINTNRVLSRRQILDQVWEADFRGNPGIVEQYVSLLRKKVDSTQPRLIHTIRSVGYVLRAP
ncbi:response regulator transcription factor [Nonomuraea endophytica]|uniref:response regulator transcription factor n=1 Tax=Nonomuraea endophytica TaxID=714136 RepID=UPI0037CA06D1